jgi:hypothetical protein
MYSYAIPETGVEDNLSIVSFVRHPMLDGIVPWRDVDSIYIDSRLLSCPMVVGRVPLSLRLLKYSNNKLDIDPKASGMEPRKYMYTGRIT